jgi:hypothetical protein
LNRLFSFHPPKYQLTDRIVLADHMILQSLIAMENIMNGSPSSDDFLDSPLGFQLSPEFRPRASSNASSCGRLSPIQAANEPDLDKLCRMEF